MYVHTYIHQMNESKIVLSIYVSKKDLPFIREIAGFKELLLCVCGLVIIVCITPNMRYPSSSLRDVISLGGTSFTLNFIFTTSCSRIFLS